MAWGPVKHCLVDAWAVRAERRYELPPRYNELMLQYRLEGGICIYRSAAPCARHSLPDTVHQRARDVRTRAVCGTMCLLPVAACAVGRRAGCSTTRTAPSLCTTTPTHSRRCSTSSCSAASTGERAPWRGQRPRAHVHVRTSVRKSGMARCGQGAAAAVSTARMFRSLRPRTQRVWSLPARARATATQDAGPRGGRLLLHAHLRQLPSRHGGQGAHAHLAKGRRGCRPMG